MREPEHRYIPGDNWGICAECGMKFRMSELRKRWDGFLVCRKDWEPRHPQENTMIVPDKVIANQVSPEGEDTFISTPVTQDDL